MKDIKVGLCLSGGGALGSAYIGVLEEFVKHEIPIDMVAGTSFGALVGAYYAAGFSPAEMKELMLSFKRRNISDFSLFFKDGLLRGRRVIKYLNQHFKDKNIEDLNIPFCALACDLKTGTKVSQRTGSLIDALRATTSVPAIFSPLKRGDMLLVDGGIVDNLPVSDLREMGADFVIAVDMHGLYSPEGSLNKLLSVTISSLKVMLNTQSELKADKGDIYIAFAQPEVSIAKFDREGTEKSIEYGRVAAANAIDEIKAKLKELK